MNYEFILMDRIQKIKQVINEYGESNFSISFSGGKDSTVLSWLVDKALPENNIPRVYADTGIELNLIRQFVYEKQKTDNRIIIIKPESNIRNILETYGYPFKSKAHSTYVKKYQSKGFEYKSVRAYTGQENTLAGKPMFVTCPKILMYQFTNENKLKISDMCCVKLKEEPLINWQKHNNKVYSIVGIMRDEGGRRDFAQCMVFKSGKFSTFQPLVAVSKEWENWLINEYNIDICSIYKEPYNFERTGCKGCPFAIHLQQELDTLEKFFPAERKQCEIIWAPVYAEYRKIGYRLKKGSVL